MPIKYVPFIPEPVEGQAVLGNFNRILRYKGADDVSMTLQRGMPLYEMEKQETVGENSDGNMVIRGECVSACAYLKEQGIQVDLVYIDPPFASGADYAKKVYIRRNPKVAEVIAQAEQELDVDELKAFEEKMYGDVWDKEKYLNWMYENLMAIKSVMSENASIYVHIDWHIGHYVKILLDEVFGEDNFRNEITWVRTASHNDSKQNYSRVKDSIFFYSRSEEYPFNIQYTPYTEEYIADEWTKAPSGRYYKFENMLDPQNKMAAYDFHGTVARWRTTPEKFEELDYFGKGKSLEALKSNLWVYRNEIYENGDPDSIFYVDILVAVIIVACENSSWSLLPSSSGILDEEWESYLQSKMSIKMLWPAQRLIAEKGLLRGESSIVQLPTGVGKTRSIELIIRAAFLSERANIAIIVAPLRALCNEITMDMYKAFGNDVTINQFSDVLQNDFWNLFSEDIKRQILICTPEKLSYVLHHDPFFLSAIDLFVFDEGHMFDDGGRGATYELLVTHIRQNITSEQQLVLLSAVLPNSGDIAQWLFEDRGCLATDDSIVSTPKSIGFSSTQRDIHFFSDDKSNEDYYIPRILRVEQLKKLPRERSNKYFPDLSLSTDVAIYNAIKLCHNGGVAIYLGQQRSMKTVFERIINLDKRNYDLKALKDNTNQAELSKIKGFIESYYGSEHYYTKAAELGVLPHSSNLQNGVKLVVEHALKNKYVSCVVCTSTLAQGVNIPIKYLLVTSIRNGLKLVKARDLSSIKSILC